MMAKRVKAPLALRKPIADAIALAVLIIAVLVVLYGWMALVAMK